MLVTLMKAWPSVLSTLTISLSAPSSSSKYSISPAHTTRLNELSTNGRFYVGNKERTSFFARLRKEFLGTGYHLRRNVSTVDPIPSLEQLNQHCTRTTSKIDCSTARLAVEHLQYVMLTKIEDGIYAADVDVVTFKIVKGKIAEVFDHGTLCVASQCDLLSDLSSHVIHPATNSRVVNASPPTIHQFWPDIFME